MREEMLTGGREQGGALGDVCDCCRQRIRRAVFRIVTPREGERRICRGCAGHVSLTAAGVLWMPRCCPDVLRPQVRVSHRPETRGPWEDRW
ncbi:MAG: hypothetical protein M1396_04565 [Chloroflexi bacterium]|nr:hypothetical protein [Chloroflexota bacterium]